MPDHRRDDPHRPARTTVHGAPVFDVPAIVAREVVGAKQGDEDVRLPKRPGDPGAELVARIQVPVEPDADAVAHQRGEMGSEPFHRGRVEMRVGDEYADHRLATVNCG